MKGMSNNQIILSEAEKLAPATLHAIATAHHTAAQIEALAAQITVTEDDGTQHPGTTHDAEIMLAASELHTFDYWKKEGKSVKLREKALIESAPPALCALAITGRLSLGGCLVQLHHRLRLVRTVERLVILNRVVALRVIVPCQSVTDRKPNLLCPVRDSHAVIKRSGKDVSLVQLVHFFLHDVPAVNRDMEDFIPFFFVGKRIVFQSGVELRHAQFVCQVFKLPHVQTKVHLAGFCYRLGHRAAHGYGDFLDLCRRVLFLAHDITPTA